MNALVSVALSQIYDFCVKLFQDDTSKYILRYIDSLKLRQAIQRQLNIVELSNRLSKAVSVGNGGEMIFLTHREQLISDACKNFIKSALVCWNYLYATKYIQSLDTDKEKNAFMEKMKRGNNDDLETRLF